MNKDSRNKGFSAPELLGALLVVGAIVLGATYVYSKNNADNTLAAGAEKSRPVHAATSQIAYLDIKEWGVKIPLSEPISDLYYVPSTGSQDTNGQPNTMWFGFKSITDKACVPTATNVDGTQMAGIFKVLPNSTDPVKGTPYKTLYPNGTTVDGYYYAFADELLKGKTSCVSQNKLENIDTALNAAMNHIIADR